MGADSWCAAVDCAHPDLLSGAVVLVGLGVLTLVALAVLAHLGEAESVVERERRRTRRERDAFVAFVERVSDVDVVESRPRGATDGGMVLGPREETDAAGLREVRRAYRETVMSMPHFDAEYGESLPEHMSAEFDVEVAAAVTRGPRLTPELQEALVRHGRVAVGQRETFMETLECEERSLLDARDAFEEVAEDLSVLNAQPLPERSFEGLAATWERLGDLESECEGVLDQRQRTLDGSRPSGRGGAPSFAGYVYRSLPVTHPVLAEGATLVDRVRTARSRVVRAMTARV